MTSWRFDPHEPQDFDMPDLYQQAVDLRVREDMLLGVAVPDGWRRPLPPVCKRCFYTVMPDGSCAGCAERASLSGRGLAEARDRMPDVQNAPRPESDEKAAA